MEKKFLRPSQNINTLCISDMIQSHPFQYLTKLNNINNYCNKVNNSFQSFSSVSKVKLPWKNFNMINIPSYFKQNYICNKEQEKQNDIKQQSRTEENEKKFWKEHQQIIKKHKEKKKQNIRPVTAKLQNKMHAKRLFEKDKNNIFLKKIIQKGTQFKYDQFKFQEQILLKLKNIGENKQNKRIKSANIMKKKSFEKKKKNSHILLDQTKNSEIHNKKKIRETIKNEQFLQFTKGQQIIKKYNKKINEVDCSISQYNIKKTINIIKGMQKRVKELE